jgi:hypothetical protein
MKTADIYSTAVVVLFGLVLYFVIIPGWVPVEEGPGFGLKATTMPIVAVVTFTILAMMYFIHRVRGKSGQSEADEEYDSTPPIPRAGWLFLLRGSVFLIVVTALFNWAGFLVAGPPTVAGFMIMMGEKRMLHVGATALVATAATWLFFWQFLKFPLP